MIIVLVLFFLLSLPVLYVIISSTNNFSSSRPHRRPAAPLPPGSSGIPILGHTVGILVAICGNRMEEWARKRVDRYGPISRLHLFGTPTVLLAGPAANKFLFTNTDSFAPYQVTSLAKLIGEKNIMQLMGDDHKRVRGAVVQSIRIDVLKKYVERIDGEARQHIVDNWIGRKQVEVLPLAKSYTFSASSAALFGINRGEVRDRLKKEFVDMMSGVWLCALGQFFLNFHKSPRASRNARSMLAKIVKEKREALKKGQCDSNQDFMTGLISLGNKKNESEESLTDEEVVDNCMMMVIAGYDSSSILITYILRNLANNPGILAEVTREQEEIANSKGSRDEPLTWNDIQKMKYTWRVAMETLRMVPPTFGSLRKVLKDSEYNGYHIPKGWQILWVAKVTHMDGAIFPQPSTFDPTRFENSPAPYSFVSFGGGPRVCPGGEFARLQILILMHYLVTKFKWHLLSKDDVWDINHAPSPSKGLPIRLEPKY